MPTQLGQGRPDDMATDYRRLTILPLGARPGRMPLRQVAAIRPSELRQLFRTPSFRFRDSPGGRVNFPAVRDPPPDESHCGSRARTYRERTFRWSTVSVPMESFSMRASRTRKRPIAIAPTATAPIAAAPRANAPTASARIAVLPVLFTPVAFFVCIISPFRVSTLCFASIIASSGWERQELRSLRVRPITARMRQQVESPRLHRYRTPCPSACE
jgi:hypothetical protein